jgi:hypothetical protein
VAKPHWQSVALVADGYLEYLYRNGVLQSFIVNTSIILILALLTHDQVAILNPIEIISSVLEPEAEFAEAESVLLGIETVQAEPTQSKFDLDVVVDVRRDANDDTPTLRVRELVFDPVASVAAVVEERDLMADLIRPTETRAAGGLRAASVGEGNASGPGAETLRRLEGAGARTGDVQVSIAWNNYNDIDLWVVFESQQGKFAINWMNRIGPANGMLDVDRNAQPTTNKAVENIFWPHGLAMDGRYTVYLQHYRQWDRVDRTPVFLRILVDGQVVEKKLTVSRHEGVKKAYSFHRRKKLENEN